MQHPYWYLARLRAMSPGEIGWRVRSVFRDRFDRLRASYPGWLADPAVREHAATLAEPCSPQWCEVPAGSWARAVAGSPEFEWCARLKAESDLLLDGRLQLFGQGLHIGTPIEWNREHVHGTSTPLHWASSIDYRDLASVGDAKIVWEPNRHQHLVVLARAYRATGDPRYVSGALDQLSSWLDQCPFGRGINWRSPLELAIRIINWTWTFDLIRDSGLLTPEFCRRFLESVHLHLWDITRKFSQGSSANNHLIGEAAGVFVASSYFSCLSAADEWRKESYEILCREVSAQTFPDGGSREQATGYHLFVFHLLTIAGLAGRMTGRDFPAAYWNRLERMLDFASVLSAGGPLPAFGDSDMGYVLDLGQEHDEADAALCLGAALFNRPDFRRGRTVPSEPVRWLLGRDVCGGVEPETAVPRSTPPVSRALSESGYYVLRSQIGDSAHQVGVVLDCGPLGFSALAAHGHADALSIVVHAFGRELLVDPGTFDYFTFPQWREYFRSTPAHNTVTVDGIDQSQQLGPFLWGARASACCLEWEPADNGGLVVGEHDGYTRLPDPVIHRRSVRLDGASPLLTIRDQLMMTGRHDVGVSFHLAEDSELERVGPHEWDIGLGRHRVRFSGDPRLEWSAVGGSEQPISGWVSRQYHMKSPTTTLTGRLTVHGHTTLECSFAFIP